MRLTIHEIGEISRSIAAEFAGELSIVGVTAADGEADHVELLIEMATCADEWSAEQINVPRTERVETERVLRDQFRRVLQRQHAGADRATA